MSESTRFLLRERDLVVMVLVLVGLYMSLDTPKFSYRIEPAWFLDLRDSLSLKEWIIPAPIVTDLDGDGKKEIILITKDFQLKVMSAEVPHGVLSDIYTPELIRSEQLPFGDIEIGKTPVTMKTGYIEPYNADKKRAQVVVVVNEDTSITCFDAKLNTLWQSGIFRQLRVGNVLGKFRADDVAISILPLSLDEGSSGVVIVGASMSLRHGEDHFKVEKGMNLHEDGDQEHPEIRAKALLEHFNVHAFDAHSGRLIWSHGGFDVRVEQYSKSLPQFAFRLDRRDLVTQVHRDPSIPDWTVFKDSLVAELPHDWHSHADTSLRIAHFARRHMGAGAASQAERPKGSKTKKQREAAGMLGKRGAFTGRESVPLIKTAALPHDAFEHTDKPNVLVCHTRRGLEVISLKTGAPMVSMALTEGQTYADVDGDGVVDAILLLESSDDLISKKESTFAEDVDELQHCSMMVVSGLPARAQLFNGSICEGKHSMQESLSHSMKKPPHEVSAASPVLLRSPGPRGTRGGIERDVVVAVNTGVVTCYSGRGVFKWQLQDAPTWSLGNRNASAMLFDMDAGRADALGKHDNDQALVLITGEDRISLISREGDILASAYMPKMPIMKPIIGDFDNDGITDIIVLTSDAYLGYKTEVSAAPRGLFIALVILVFAAALIFLLSMKSELIIIDGIKQEHSNKRTFSLIRSTDESHID